MQNQILQVGKNIKLEIAGNEKANLLEYTGDAGVSNETSTEIFVEPNGYLAYTLAVCGTSSLAKKVDIFLAEAAEVDVKAIFFGEMKDNHKVKVTMHHEGAHSQSTVRAKAILKDEAKNSFKGLVKISAGAQKSDARLEQRVLLLDKNASSEGQPELEILANDVKASHAAAVGRVDQAQLFYMTSRGIEPNLAKKMIIEGFLQDLIGEIAATDQQEKVKELFQAKFA